MLQYIFAHVSLKLSIKISLVLKFMGLYKKFIRVFTGHSPMVLNLYVVLCKLLDVRQNNILWLANASWYKTNIIGLSLFYIKSYLPFPQKKKKKNWLYLPTNNDIFLLYEWFVNRNFKILQYKTGIYTLVPENLFLQGRLNSFNMCLVESICM